MQNPLSRILITGAYGFVGSRLVPALADRFPESELFVTKLHLDSAAADHPVDRAGAISFACDLTKAPEIRNCLAKIAPTCIINLAAQSHVPTAWQQPDLTWKTNLDAVRIMLECLVEQDHFSCFAQIGSCDCYGRAFNTGVPLQESNAFEPLNPYAASKAAADMLCSSYRNQKNLRVIRLRPFNHTGPGQNERFVIPAFAAQIAKIEAGLQSPEIRVGNLDAQRSFLHVDDVLEAYLLVLAEQHQIASGETFNISADQPIKIAALLQRLLALSTRNDIKVIQDPARMRPSDIPIAQVSSGKIRDQLDWSAKIAMPNILSDVLNYWRQAVAFHPSSKDVP